MAIKLADVIQRTNAEYPVVEAYDQTILGFYNGYTSEAQQALQLYYNGESKEEFAVANSASNEVRFTKLPYVAGAGTADSTVGAGDARSLLTIEGGLFVTKDSKLYNDNGGNESLGAVYVNQVVNAGNTPTVDSLRSSLGRASELVQQFNRYESLASLTLDSSVSLASIIENDEDLWLAGYDAERSRMRKFGITDLLAAFASQLGQELVTGGIITSTDAGGSGAIGDLNGDGEVTVSDLLILMGSFGGGSTDDNYVSKFRMLTSSGDQISLTPTATPDLTGSGTGGALNWSDIETFAFNLNYGTNNAVYGWSSFTAPLNVADDNYVQLNTRATGTTADNWFAGKALRAAVTAKISGPFTDFIVIWLRVRVITTNSEKYEQVYYMNPEGATNNHLFIYGSDLDSTPSQSVVPTFFYKSGEPDLITSANYEATDTGVTESAILATNEWSLTSTAGDFAGDAGVQTIDDIEVRFGVFSYTGLTTVTISRIHVYVDEEVLFHLHPD